jgi:hypothetical protein
MSSFNGTRRVVTQPNVDFGRDTPRDHFQEFGAKVDGHFVHGQVKFWFKIGQWRISSTTLLLGIHNGVKQH